MGRKEIRMSNTSNQKITIPKYKLKAEKMIKEIDKLEEKLKKEELEKREKVEELEIPRPPTLE